MVVSHETTGEVLNNRNIRNGINLWAPQRTTFLVQRVDIYLWENIAGRHTSCTMADEIYFDYQLSGRPQRKKTKERLWSVLIACFVAAFGPFSFGYGMGYSSAAVTQLENANATDLHLDKEGITWFSVSCFIFIISCLSSLLGSLGDMFSCLLSIEIFHCKGFLCKRALENALLQDIARQNLSCQRQKI